MIRQGICILAVSALAMMLASCQQSQTVDANGGAPREVRPSTELAAMSRPPVPDVPLPVGFELEENRSRNVSGRGMRWVDHSYLGTASRYAVSRFYKRQMPVNRWELVSDVFTRGTICLDFRRETETCRITIGDGTWLRGTRVQVLLLPWGPIPRDVNPATPPEN